MLSQQKLIKVMLYLQRKTSPLTLDLISKGLHLKASEIRFVFYKVGTRDYFDIDETKRTRKYALSEKGNSYINNIEYSDPVAINKFFFNMTFVRNAWA